VTVWAALGAVRQVSVPERRGARLTACSRNRPELTLIRVGPGGCLAVELAGRQGVQEGLPCRPDAIRPTFRRVLGSIEFAAAEKRNAGLGLGANPSARRERSVYADVIRGRDPPVIGGQVILSSPGGPCMTCMGFLTEERLATEAARYGNAGSRPQVVWPNGVLASTAVGIAVDLVTGWTRKNLTHAYLVYNGNDGTLAPSKTLMGVERCVCTHFSADGVGDPIVLVL
jgi:hypothetical protein